MFTPINKTRLNMEVQISLRGITCCKEITTCNLLLGVNYKTSLRTKIQKMDHQHTSTNGHHCLRVVRAVNVEATDILICGNDSKRCKLFTEGTIMRGMESRGAGAGLLISRLRKTKVWTSSIVGTTGICSSC